MVRAGCSEGFVHPRGPFFFGGIKPPLRTNCNPLLLAARQAQASLADLGLVAGGRRCDKLVDVGLEQA